MTVTDVAPVPAFTGDAHPFRRRLLDGLADSIAERGYRETTIADIVRHARTSKRTFYQEFSSKEECFIDLLWTANQEMMAHIRAAVDPEAPWQDQIRQAIDAYCDSIESRPAITLSWIREMPALGTVVRSVQRRGIEDLTEMLVELTDSPGFRRADVPPISKPVAVILLGGLRELTAQTVEDKRDVREIVDAAVSTSIAVVGRGARPH
ncbi:TetR/AcrR family transcriptional regulator [Mycobacterium sp.]|uniref:TetR/AcrR family transcriptional regulator n=1 Tax=Mycobacterium sp. TaxID=1785 RepID=UPI002CAEE805|nr:TetR/AcrR family transcriptional regulator [Mycobacterium sp.]HME46886.1 TetR/AcrR family transcriptional regulator [Mycobacterium sp.]